MITAAGLEMRQRLEVEIPPFRPVAMQLLHLAGDPTVSIGQIVTLLLSDAALSGGILRLANSPQYTARQEIVNVRQAVAYLGLDQVRSLAITAAMRGVIDNRPNPLAQPFWRHSLATALTCRKMCGLARVAPETAYTAGLLHDIGQLGLIRVLPDYAELIGQAVAEGEELVDAERRIYDTDHCQAGRWLLSRWRLPLELQNVIANHEKPPQRETCDRALTVLVHAGSKIADHIGMAVIPPARELTMEELMEALADLRREDFSESMPAIVDWVLQSLNGIETSL